MATHSKLLAWRISQAENTGGLQSIWWQRVRHDWNNWVWTYFVLSNSPSASLSLNVCVYIHTNTHTRAYIYAYTYEWVKVAQLFLTLCDPMNYTVHGILPARIPEWIAIPFSRWSSQLRYQTQVSCIAGGFFTTWATREALYICIRKHIWDLRYLHFPIWEYIFFCWVMQVFNNS